MQVAVCSRRPACQLPTKAGTRTRQRSGWAWAHRECDGGTVPRALLGPGSAHGTIPFYRPKSPGTPSPAQRMFSPKPKPMALGGTHVPHPEGQQTHTWKATGRSPSGCPCRGHRLITPCAAQGAHLSLHPGGRKKQVPRQGPRPAEAEGRYKQTLWTKIRGICSLREVLGAGVPALQMCRVTSMASGRACDGDSTSMWRCCWLREAVPPDSQQFLGLPKVAGSEKHPFPTKLVLSEEETLLIKPTRDWNHSPSRQQGPAVSFCLSQGALSNAWPRTEGAIAPWD